MIEFLFMFAVNTFLWSIVGLGVYGVVLMVGGL